MSAGRAADEPIPVAILGGYLGAGKTTLVNRLLRQAGGRRLAVLVNDFGDICIDASLIEGAEGGVLSLAGGCICCDFGSDLAETLEMVGRRVPRPDAIVIETSGVALPGAVAQAVRLCGDLAVTGVFVAADASAVRDLAADRYVGDTVLRQLRDADLVLMTKTDLIDESARAALTLWLADQVPAAKGVVLGPDTSPAALLLDLAPAPAGPPGDRATNAPSHAHFETGVRTFAGRVDVAALAAELASPHSQLVRAKGVLTGLDGARRVIQAVGRRVDVSDAPAGLDRRDIEGRLVWIRAPEGH